MATNSQAEDTVWLAGAACLEWPSLSWQLFLPDGQSPLKHELQETLYQGMLFFRGEIGSGPVELEFEVKIVFANVLSLILFTILTAVKGAI